MQALNNGARRRRRASKAPPNGRRDVKHEGPQPDAEAFEKFLGHALQVTRLAGGLTQEQVAEALSRMLEKLVRQTYVSKVEKGRIKISLKRLRLFCEILQVSPVVLIEMAVALAEEGKEPDDADFREALVEVGKRLRDGSRPPVVQNLLQALHSEIERRLSRR